MSLLDAYARPCVRMDKTGVEDGEGGSPVQWKDGAPFTVYFALDTSMEARRAERTGVTSLYSALADQDAPIGYDDYFKDSTTGLTYRVTSNPAEKASPLSAGFALKYFTAERKELPT